MHDPSELALTASSPPLFLTAMQLMGPLWSLREASMEAVPFEMRQTRTMPAIAVEWCGWWAMLRCEVRVGGWVGGWVGSVGG